MLLRVAVTVTALALGVAAGGWVAGRSDPPTSLQDAASAAHVAFPSAGEVRNPDAVPGYIKDPPDTPVVADEFRYQGFEFPVGGSGGPGRADLMAQARARLEAAGWHTWGLGRDGDFAAARDGLGLATERTHSSMTIVNVGAINARVWPAAMAAGLAFAVLAWLAVPALFRGRRNASLVAAVSVVAMLPATFLTLAALGTSLLSLGEPWPAPWIAFLLGSPPLALLAAITLLGACVAGLFLRGSRPPSRDAVAAAA